MNDFTKDELIIIRKLINSTDEKIITESDEIMIVQSKIQNMIDNYCDQTPACEHKWLNMAYAYMQCEKCLARKGINE